MPSYVSHAHALLAPYSLFAYHCLSTNPLSIHRPYTPQYTVSTLSALSTRHSALTVLTTLYTITISLSELCSCCFAPRVCMMVYCCPCVPLAQLYERVVEAGTFPAVLVFSGLLLLLPQILYQMGLYTDSESAKDSFFEAVGGTNLLAKIVMVFLLIRVRSNVRRHYNIPETTCRGCEVYVTLPIHYYIYR